MVVDEMAMNNAQNSRWRTKALHSEAEEEDVDELESKQAAIDGDGEDEIDVGEVAMSNEDVLDTINKLAGRLNLLQVEIGELGGDYSSISAKISDAVDKLYAVYRRNEIIARKSVKKSNSRQTHILAFTKR